MAIDIVRAWKDHEYRKTLTPAELASVPPHPAGMAELTDDELMNIAGGLMAPCSDATHCCVSGADGGTCK